MQFIPIILIFVTVLIDLLTKYYMYVYFHAENRLHTTIEIIGEWLRFRYVENKGMAFGMFSDLNPDIKHYLFSGLTIVAIAVILYYYFSVKKKKTIVRSSLALILGGALGNFADKVFGYFIYEGKNQFFFGKVVDFIDMGIGMDRWPTYNVADIAISLGVFTLLIVILLNKNVDLFNDDNDNVEESKS